MEKSAELLVTKQAKKAARAERRAHRREVLLEVIEPSHSSGALSAAYDILIIALVLLNVVAIIAETFEISESLRRVFEWTEYVSVAVFTLDYIFHLSVADIKYKLPAGKARLKFIFSFMGIIDLLALLPFYLPLVAVNLRVLHALRILRLLWLLKLKRYTSALDSITTVIKRKWHQLVTALLCIGIMMLIASILMFDFEHDAQPEIYKNAFSAMWLVFASLTKASNDSVEPLTTMGRALSMFLAMLELALIAIPTGILSAGFVEHSRDESSSAEKAPVRTEPEPQAAHEDAGVCPHCGERL